MRRTGFTLIELLIVVAIIAILAAIAVPNFLEAQMRSKIARCAADLRSTVTAIEAYHVDWNVYFPANRQNPAAFGQFWLVTEYTDGTYGGVGFPLTTPVAYMTSIPYDIFNTVVGAKNSNNVERCGLLFGDAGNNQTVANFGAQDPPTLVNITGSYYLDSVGPDETQFGVPQYPGGPLEIIAFYDPTNGTVSEGDIDYAGGRWLSGVK